MTKSATSTIKKRTSRVIHKLKCFKYSTKMLKGVKQKFVTAALYQEMYNILLFITFRSLRVFQPNFEISFKIGK